MNHPRTGALETAKAQRQLRPRPRQHTPAWRCPGTAGDCRKSRRENNNYLEQEIAGEPCQPCLDEQLVPLLHVCLQQIADTSLSCPTSDSARPLILPRPSCSSGSTDNQRPVAGNSFASLSTRQPPVSSIAKVALTRITALPTSCFAKSGRQRPTFSARTTFSSFAKTTRLKPS